MGVDVWCGSTAAGDSGGTEHSALDAAWSSDAIGRLTAFELSVGSGVAFGASDYGFSSSGDVDPSV